MAFSPDGKHLATASEDKTAKVWDAVSGQELLTLAGHSDGVFTVVFSPDGKRLADTSRDGTARVWDAVSGQELLTLRGGLVNGNLASINGIAYSPDGKRDATVGVWDAVSGKKLLTLRGHTGSVLAVACSPDGRHLAAASQDGTVKLWDEVEGRRLQTLPGHSGIVNGVAYSPDGKRLASSSTDGTVQVYALDVSELLNLARSRVTRDLTAEECQLYLQTESCHTLW